MRTRWGLVSAWWKSDQKLLAWSLVGTIVATSLSVVGTGIVGAYVAGQLLQTFTEAVTAAAQQNPEMVAEAAKDIAVLLGVEGGLVAANAALNGAKDIAGKFMHLKWRNWLGDQLETHLLRNRHFVHLVFNKAANDDDPARMPDNIDQRIQESVKNMTGSVGGLAMGAAHTSFSVLGFGGRLFALSVPVAGLSMFGSSGFATLAIGAMLAYVGPMTYIAYRQARVLKDLMDAQQTTEGDYRAVLNGLVNNADQIAAAGNERIEKKVIDAVYRPVDSVWKKYAVSTSIYAAFLNLQSGFAGRVYSYLPSLPGLLSGDFNIAQFQETASLTRANIDESSWVIKTLPDWANLGANVDRVTSVVEAMLAVEDAKEHYAKSGVAEMEYATRANGGGIVLENVELMHQGQEKAFLRAPYVHLKPGKFTAVMGPSGCGKTTLIKAIFQLHPYGRGLITVPENASAMEVGLPGARKSLYVAQDAFLPDKLTLKQLVCMPADEDDPAFDDVRVADALAKVGLEGFIGNLRDEHHDGRNWDKVFSGGQKQLIVLARILLHQPDILVLDEAVSALDAATKIRFHDVLKRECPHTAVVSIIHDPELIGDSDGPSFYDELVLMNRGRRFDSGNPTFETSQFDMTETGNRRIARRALQVALGMPKIRRTPAPNESVKSEPEGARPGHARDRNPGRGAHSAPRFE